MIGPSGDLLTVEIISTDFPSLLRLAGSHGIPILHMRDAGILTVKADIRRSDYPQIKKLLESRGEKISTCGYKGIGYKIRAMITRPVLVIGLIILTLISFFLPTRVFFVSVQGNESIPERLILEQAQQCGIAFGARRRDVRSEKMKNNLVAAIDQLQWAGINTYGCTATITVKERTVPGQYAAGQGVANIVAARDGVIQNYTATKGNAVCQIGGAVKEGEVLISGYTDCGIKIQATRAEGEVFAQTVWELHAVEPTEYVLKTFPSASVKKYSVEIGKKRINFYKDSGISGSTCDKIRKEYTLQLPGGFDLPVTIVEETYVAYKGETGSLDSESEDSRLCDYVQRYLKSQMISGTILEKSETVATASGMNYLTGRYVCLEMIGRVRNEEIWDNYGTND